MKTQTHPSITRHRYATFYSPGTLFSESNTVEVGLDESLKDIAARAKAITQRHGAKPYGFDLEVTEHSAVVVDGKTFAGETKQISKTGMHFLTGTVLTLADIPNTDENRILRSNMRNNDIAAVVENRNSYRSTMPFNADDVVIDWDGNILARGADYYKTPSPALS